MSDLLYSVENRVATIAINRPKSRNPMTREMWEELRTLLENAWHDDDIGCVVLTGVDNAFCAGADINGMKDRLINGHSTSIEQESAFIRNIMEAARFLHEMPKPTIAAITGPAAGAGLSLALACDMRLMAKEAKLTPAFANIGASGDFGGSWFLSNIIGTAKARELYYFSRVLNGGEAESMGVVNKTVLRAELDAEVKTWAEKLANGPAVALAYTKRNMNLCEHGTLSQLLDQEALLMTLCLRTEDHREAALAFLEKRPPKFKGK